MISCVTCDRTYDKKNRDKKLKKLRNSGLTFSGLSYFFGSLLLSRQQLLDSLTLICHYNKNKLMKNLNRKIRNTLHFTCSHFNGMEKIINFFIVEKKSYDPIRRIKPYKFSGLGFRCFIFVRSVFSMNFYRLHFLV